MVKQPSDIGHTLEVLRAWLLLFVGAAILFVVLAIPDFVAHTHSWSSVNPVFHVRCLEHHPSLKVLTVDSCLCPGVMFSADVGLSVPGPRARWSFSLVKRDLLSCACLRSCSLPPLVIILYWSDPPSHHAMARRQR